VNRTAVPATLLAAALLAAGCAGSDGPEYPQASPPQTTVNPSDLADDQAPRARLVVDVMIQGGKVTPTNEQVDAAVNEPIILRVNSDVADALHVHSNPEHTFEIEAKPGQSFQFTVNVPGKVDVELHQLKKTIATIAVQ
jgi:PBP1b-binding outer membrane lipoprotein LpoB